jgi:2-succinyl-6-hydroxy-2,4-cyclohexadiene-1-carboxylate synthase
VPLAVERLGAGEPRLVLAHGLTQTGRSWRHVATVLAGRHEVVLVDLPGHGRSGAVRAGVEDGARLLGEAGGRAVYVGYSMGGRHVLRLACDRPALVIGMVLLGATAGLADPAERAARRAGDEALATGLERDGVDAFLERWLAQPLFAGLPDDPAEREERRRNTVAGLAASLRLAGTGTQEPLWDRLGECEVPALVLAGELDAKFTHLGRRLADALGGPTRFATVPGAGHAAHLERPAAVTHLITTWLASLPR